MTTYGTIQSEPQTSNVGLGILANARDGIQSGLSAKRPWIEVFQWSTLALPNSFDEAIERIRSNALFFRVNYAIIILASLSITLLLWHPPSMILFIITIIAWLFLYFLREGALVIFGWAVSDLILIILLLASTAAVLLLTKMAKVMVIGLSVGTTLVLLHGAMRITGDMFPISEEEESIGVRRQGHARLKNAASSFSAS